MIESLKTTGDAVFDFLARSKDIAPWFEMVGSIAALSAAYYFGRAEKHNKQRTYAMTAWIVTSDAYGSLSRCVVRLVAESENSPGYFSRLTQDSEKLLENTRSLMEFPMHELKPNAVLDFNSFRRNVQHICSIIYNIASEKHIITVGAVAEVMRDFVFADEYYSNLRNQLGYNAKRVLEQERQREVEIGALRDAILAEQEARLSGQPGRSSEISRLRWRRRHGWPGTGDLKRHVPAAPRLQGRSG
ncbi:MAG: hypothetical protein Q8L23_10025 [Caulobacter sp.]|nr:hypothetical protein [Caulobacter sp.]